MNPSDFDYVAYDAEAQTAQLLFKTAFIGLAGLADGLKSARWKEQFRLNCEYAYMCVGKAIRDDQIARNGSAPLQESRGNE